jgi:hypothetical protein
VSRHCFDIEGLGSKHIIAFWEDGLIRQPGDIFRLDAEVIAQRERWGAVSAAKLVAAIDERRRIALDRFINALGIPQVGQATAAPGRPIAARCCLAARHGSGAGQTDPARRSSRRAWHRRRHGDRHRRLRRAAQPRSSTTLPAR